MIIRVKGLTKADFIQFESLVKQDSLRILDSLALRTLQVLIGIIQSKIKRPDSTGNLANSMNIIRGHNYRGVGEISVLNARAPYWYWQNYGVAQSGRTTPPGTAENPRIRGAFSPGQSAPDAGVFRTGRFVKGGYPMNPTRPIPPMNYIEGTWSRLSMILEEVIRSRG